MSTLRQQETKLFERVNPLVKFSVTRYVLAIAIFVAIVAFGGLCCFLLGVDLMPSVNVPMVNVSTSYTGSGPSVIDQQVTQVIENAVSSVAGITDISSTSSQGSSRVSISFDMSVDKNAALGQVSAAVNAAVRRLPSGVQSPVIRSFDSNSSPVVQFGVTGSGAPLTEVSDWVQDSLAPTLERVPGVANVSFNGAPSRQFRVLLNPSKLKYYSLSPAQISSAISGASINQPIGTINTNSTSLTFATQNALTNLDDIRRVLVDSNKGISVGDVATVRDVPSDNDYARINGMPVVLVSVQRASDSNSIAVADGVSKVLKSAQFPAGYVLMQGNDSTGAIRASVDNTFRELWMTLIVVAIIVLLFIGKPNTAFAVILAVPIALAASPILFRLAGFSFNLISLLAMVTAIGIVVDDSIVLAENVERYRAMGFEPKEAVLKGASEVFSAVVAASLSLLAVLIPVSFVGGMIGRYLQQFSLGLAAAVAMSLFEALLFLTVRLAYSPDAGNLHWKDFLRSFGRAGEAMKWGFSAWKRGPFVLLALAVIGGLVWLKRFYFIPLIVLYPVALGILNYALFMGLSLFESVTELLHGWTDRFVSWVRDGYARLLTGMIDRSVVVLAVTGVLFASVAIFVAPVVFRQMNFVPSSDSGSMSVSVSFPPGMPQAKANEVAAKVEAFLLAQPEIVTVQSVVSNRVEETVILVPVGKRPGVAKLAQTYRAALQPLVQKDYPTARVSVGSGGIGGGGGGGGFGGSSLQLTMVAFNMDTLTQGNSAIVAAIEENPYVADVTSSLSDATLENDFEPDPSKMASTGIAPQAVASLLQTYTSGSQASSVVTGGQSFPIMVQIDPTILQSGQTLLDLPIYSSALQSTLQVGQLGSFKLNEKPNSISRYNRQYQGSLTVNLKANAPTTSEMQKSIVDDLRSRGLLDGGIAITTGSRFSSASLTSQLATAGWQIFLLAFFLAYLVMAAQFNSWRYPIYLLLPVPLAIIGAILTVWLVGGGIDIFGILGMLLLIGLSAKNAILYLDFVVERIGTMPLKDALIEAASLRFRPIVMTTLTVLVISFPLVFSSGQGSEFGQRMGVVMFGGILFSAILTFFVVPAAFYVFERKRADSESPAQTAADAI